MEHTFCFFQGCNPESAIFFGCEKILIILMKCLHNSIYDFAKFPSLA